MASVDLKTGTGTIGDTADLDTGPGVDEHGVVAIGLPATGGHVVGGTATNPLRIDPTGDTTQPVSAASLPLPAGAATEATLATRASEATLAALLTAFGLEDFASETSLAALLSAFTLEDFAQEATLSDGSQIAQAVGDVAHDSADSGAPVKIGGTATVALPAAVDEGDRVQASFDLQGRLRTTGGGGGGGGQIEGDVAHDSADSGNPVKVGGTATASAPVAVDEGDRVQASFDLQGRVRTILESAPLPTGAATEATLSSLEAKDFATQTTLAAFLAAFNSEDFASETTLAALLSAFNAEDFATEATLATRATAAAQIDGSQIAQAVGDTAHDAADAGAPVKIGGVATEAFPVRVDEGDRVNGSFDLHGRARTTTNQIGVEHFTDEQIVTIPHEAGYFPDVRAFLEVPAGEASAYGMGGFGSGGFGGTGGLIPGETRSETGDFLLFYTDENEMIVVFTGPRTGVLTYHARN